MYPGESEVLMRSVNAIVFFVLVLLVILAIMAWDYEGFSASHKAFVLMAIGFVALAVIRMASWDKRKGPPGDGGPFDDDMGMWL